MRTFYKHFYNKQINLNSIGLISVLFPFPSQTKNRKRDTAFVLEINKNRKSESVISF